MSRLRFTIFLIIIAFLFVSCNHNRTNLPTIPSIDSFSDQELEFGNQSASRISSATLTCNGEEIEIAIDDPRLIRLLNLVFYSESEGLTTWTTRYIEEAEILERLSTEAPSLDILMLPSQENSGFLCASPRILICKGCTMLFVAEDHYPLGYQGLLAEDFYPFGCFILEETSEDYDSLVFVDWGNESWIDLLEHSGFVDANDNPL